MFPSHIRRARLATVLAVGTAVLVSGAAAGAAGAAFILGAANSAGSAATSLTSSNTGQTLLVRNSSANGWAIRGISNSGIGGLFQSSGSTGMAGFTSTADKYAVVGTQNASSFGGGAAVLGEGRNNHGVHGSARNTFSDAVRGIHGASQADPEQGFYGNGVYGESATTSGNGIFGVSTAFEGWAVWGNAEDPTGVGVVGSTNDEAGLAGLFFGDVVATGTVFASEFVTETASVVAVVEGGALQAGDPVAVAGVTTGHDDGLALVVRRAQSGDDVIGLADRQVQVRTDSRGGSRLVYGDATATAGELMSVVTGGLLALPSTGQLQTLPVGSEITLGSAGLRAAGAGDRAIGRVAGSLADGRVAIFLN
jgi:hypothetical protein